VAQFRDNIGINFLKYGAAYIPWLKTSLPVELKFRDILFAYEGGPPPTSATSLALLMSLTNNPAIQQLLFDMENSKTVVDTLKAKLQPGGPLVDAGVKDLRDQVKKLQTEFRAAFNIAANTTIASLAAKIQPIYLKVRQILTEVKTVSDSLPAIVGTLPVPSNTQTVDFNLQKDIETLKEQGRSFFNALATHHKEILVKPGAVVLLAAGAPLNDVITFLGYTPATLANVPVDPAVHDQYRLLAAKKSVFDQLAAIAGAATPNTAAAVNTAVAGCIPATSDDLKTRIETEITTAKGGAANAAAVAISVARSYVDEEILMGVTTVAGLPDVLPASIYTNIFLDLMKLKQAAANAAAVPGATKANVVTAVTIVVALEREYASLAAGGGISVAGRTIAFYESIQSTANVYETTFDQSLLQSFGIYKTLITKAGQDMMTLPPSGGVAGVYASVDSNRGVWKAPANASLASVLGPHTIINVQDQEGLNIDPNAGKSINAIRHFTGRGTLVWGTRTLAGNDSEWRYVPVRRFFNYAEESIKKATEPFVFEPNDLNTWVRVKAMIENFLTLEWRRGALAGAKPDDAFYVKVGLGETMTSLDILDGRMIIEVGMAVVRPAEFIILRFAHIMQES
jgi:stage V sporulation protein SpoVS